ncbi:hypothetical protein N9043_00910 [bacterium]|nr:hypothetical protein [bacterium]
MSKSEMKYNWGKMSNAYSGEFCAKESSKIHDVVCVAKTIADGQKMLKSLERMFEIDCDPTKVIEEG